MSGTEFQQPPEVFYELPLQHIAVEHNAVNNVTSAQVPGYLKPEYVQSPVSQPVAYGLVQQDSFRQGGCVAMPVTLRISMLNLKFMKLEQSCSNMQVKELQSFYLLKSSQLESDRYTSLSSAQGNFCMQTSTNNYFDVEHHSLIDRVEQSLKAIENSLAKSTAKPRSATKTVDNSSKSSTVKTNTILNPVALQIMSNWYDRNSEHPYPSYDTAEVMAKAGGISVEQVKKWFANRRLRKGDTKHITQIAKRRKRSRTVSKDDIFLTGSITHD